MSAVTGWILYYFVKFLNADMTGITNEASANLFSEMPCSPYITVGFMAIVVILSFIIISFGLQNGVERVTKHMMLALLALMLILAIISFGCKRGA